jgi:hypothetical protein
MRALLARIRSYLRHRVLGGESLIAFGGRDAEKYERDAKRWKR